MAARDRITNHRRRQGRSQLKHATLFLFVLSAVNLYAGNFPDWVENVLDANQGRLAPAGSDMWRLYDETLLEPGPKGKIKIKRRVVQRVITEHGTKDAARYLLDGDAETTRIKRLKGWHQSSYGRITTLDRGNIISFSQANTNKLTNAATTLAVFEGVGPDSVVAFESYELRESFFPQDLVVVLADFPIAKRVIEVRLPGAQLRPIHFTNWDLEPQLTGTRLTLEQLPGLQHEWMVPASLFQFPHVVINFDASAGAAVPLDQWSTFAAWYHRTFTTAAGTKPDAAIPAARASAMPPARAPLAQIFQQQIDDITYRQRYLSPGRGWLPASGQTVQRRRYGDCKDMVASFSYQAGLANIRVVPALATIGRDDYPNQDTPVSPAAFNHVIAAVPLAQSLGLDAEVVVAEQRYLLVDPTAKKTPLGRLPAQYRNRSVLICLAGGGHWTAVPEQALEQQALQAAVVGRLDETGTMTGGITFTSHGNALGLRDLPEIYDPNEVERALRHGFSLPGWVILKLATVTHPTPDQVQVICNVAWPSFLRADADGYRLPPSIVPLEQPQLEDRDRVRQQAIRVPAQTPKSWRITVNTAEALIPGATKQDWADESQSFAWEATGGKTITVHFAQQREQRTFGKQALQAGISYWENYRAHYNGFYRRATLFRTTQL